MPIIEVCIIAADPGQPARMICSDNRLPPNERYYEKPITSNYIATNSDDFMAVLEACQRRKDK